MAEFANGGIVPAGDAGGDTIPLSWPGCEYIVPESSEKRRERAARTVEELNRSLDR